MKPNPEVKKIDSCEFIASMQEIKKVFGEPKIGDLSPVGISVSATQTPNTPSKPKIRK